MAAKSLCLFNKFGFCRYQDLCRSQHVNEICAEKSCEIEKCQKRHPKLCRFFRDYGRCKFNSYCKFKHAISEPNVLSKLQQQISTMESIIDKLQQENNNLSSRIMELEQKLVDWPLESFPDPSASADIVPQLDGHDDMMLKTLS